MMAGGSLPGSVGFTYARTGDIPSNGPYAKKTKASAQNGRAVSDNTRLKPIVTEKPMNRETVRSTKPFEPKDNRSIFNDSRAKDRMNNEYSQYVQNIYKDTFIDQIPYAAPVLAAKAFNEGLPFTALSELIKQPLGVVGDAAINAIQENPESIDVKTLEEKTIPYTRLAANATFGNPVITQIGKQRVESGKKKGSKWYDFTAYELPALMDAANSYGVDGNTFTQFIEDNWKSSGGSYKKILELADKKFSKKQNGGEMKYYQEGLDFKPKTISQDGSIITPYGQWEYPGEITTIPSNEITMEGVPYPVLGISDTGDTQMMYPEEDYEFDGESVTEYPVMQKGGRVPVYTENPRDPRLRAYQDSLKLHNLSLKIANRPNGDISYGRKPEGKFNKNFTAADAMEYLYPVTPDEKAMVKLSNKSKILPTRHYPGEAGGVHFKKPVQPVQYRKPEPKKEQPVKKIEKPKPIERKQNVYEGSPVYSPGIGSGLPSALIGFANQQGDTTYIKPEDYERFAVPKYGKEFIESKKKQRNGGVNSADAQPIKKLDQLLNFTNYNKPTKGGWLDKY
jgi:hypothetical protein